MQQGTRRVEPHVDSAQMGVGVRVRPAMCRAPQGVGDRQRAAVPAGGHTDAAVLEPRTLYVSLHAADGHGGQIPDPYVGGVAAGHADRLPCALHRPAAGAVGADGEEPSALLGGSGDEGVGAAVGPGAVLLETVQEPAVFGTGGGDAFTGRFSRPHTPSFAGAGSGAPEFREDGHRVDMTFHESRQTEVLLGDGPKGSQSAGGISGAGQGKFQRAAGNVLHNGGKPLRGFPAGRPRAYSGILVQFAVPFDSGLQRSGGLTHPISPSRTKANSYEAGLCPPVLLGRGNSGRAGRGFGACRSPLP